MAICKGCGQVIAWIRTSTGRSMPCNVPSVRFEPGGGPETFVTIEGKVVRGKQGDSGVAKGFVPHFATCPCADAFRKGR